MIFILFLQFILILINLDASAVNARNQIPLLDDGNNVRVRNRSAECIFGRQIRELGSTWLPDLGPPFGVLHCMICECIRIQKKRRTVARVHCHNIKNECPIPICDEPIQQPGQCCKLCPGQKNDFEMVQDIVPQNVIEKEEKSTKHFAALLTGRSSLVLKNDYMKPISTTVDAKNDVVATGRFIFHRRTIQYSFYVNEAGGRPNAVQFLDEDGTILIEFPISITGTKYQNATGKVCGVWPRVPRDYCKLLKQEKLFVGLVWNDLVLSGQLLKYVALGTELFSALLEPSSSHIDNVAMTDTGGTAIVSISTAVVPPNVHIAAIFNGLSDTDLVPIKVGLYLDKKRTILEEKIWVNKSYHESSVNFVEITSPINLDDLRLLTRGRLIISVFSDLQPHLLRLTGNVTTKLSCELFQTVLNSHSDDITTNPYGTAGLAWFYLNSDGSLVFNIQIEDMPPEQTLNLVTLYDAGSKRKTELEDLTPYFRNNNQWANGTLDKLSPKVLEPLYAGNLALSVNSGTQTKNPLQLKGRLMSRPVSESRDTLKPVLLKRENQHTLPPSVVGIAWLSVDLDCHLNYDVTVTGLSTSSLRLELVLELLPIQIPGAPIHSRHLDDFNNNNNGNLHVEDSHLVVVHALNKDELVLLSNGIGLLKIKNMAEQQVLLVGTVQNVQVPDICQPIYNSNNNTSRKGILFDQNHIEESPVKDCYTDGRFYKEESQWIRNTDQCTMCFCQNGRDTCFKMTCPPIKCQQQPHNFTIPDGECCPMCSETVPTTKPMKKCDFNGHLYTANVYFHPFLIPYGFDTCTVCVCDVITMQMNCTRDPNCQLRHTSKNVAMWYADDENVQLMTSTTTTTTTTIVSTVVDVDLPQRILSEGGCVNPRDAKMPHRNATEYHPSIDSVGIYKRVLCKCLNGKQSCKRLRCDKNTCQKLLLRKKNDDNDDDNGNHDADTMEICCRKIRRKSRHKKIRKTLSV